MRIFITRHGETIWNTEGKMQGRLDSNLTEKGISYARKLGVYLSDIPFDKAYCSPSGRAIQTANNILDNKKVEICVLDNLAEMSFGCWEGMTHSEVQEKYEIKHYNFWNKPEDFTPIDGESFDDLINRAKDVLSLITTNSSSENVLIISHAIMVKALYFVMKGYTISEFWNSPFIEGTSLTIVDFKNGEFKFIKEATTEHL